MGRVIEFPGSVVAVEALPWGGWLVSWWHGENLLAVVEVKVNARCDL